MTVLAIKKFGNGWAESPLRDIASQVQISPELERLACDMFDTLLDEGGMGLAAPQVGQSVRLIVMRTGPNDYNPRAFVNPTIDRTKGEQLSLGEGCLSAPGKFGRVMRARVVWLSYDDMANGERRTEKLKGILAICAQHECDHLDGILFTDKLYNPLARRT